MAAGKPVIASRVGGNTELVTDGVTGYVLPPADSDALSDAVIRLLQEPNKSEEMGKEGRKMVHEKFTVEMMVKSYEVLYQELIQSAR
jgi:glycosyltransferase involved in cell wall biosynthesis